MCFLNVPPVLETIKTKEDLLRYLQKCNNMISFTCSELTQWRRKSLSTLHRVQFQYESSLWSVSMSQDMYTHVCKCFGAFVSSGVHPHSYSLAPSSFLAAVKEFKQLSKSISSSSSSSSSPSSKISYGIPSPSTKPTCKQSIDTIADSLAFYLRGVVPTDLNEFHTLFWICVAYASTSSFHRSFLRMVESKRLEREDHGVQGSWQWQIALCGNMLEHYDPRKRTFATSISVDTYLGVWDDYVTYFHLRFRNCYLTLQTAMSDQFQSFLSSHGFSIPSVSKHVSYVDTSKDIEECIDESSIPPCMYVLCRRVFSHLTHGQPGMEWIQNHERLVLFHFLKSIGISQQQIVDGIHRGGTFQRHPHLYSILSDLEYKYRSTTFTHTCSFLSKKGLCPFVSNFPSKYQPLFEEFSQRPVDDSSPCIQCQRTCTEKYSIDISMAFTNPFQLFQKMNKK